MRARQLLFEAESEEDYLKAAWAIVDSAIFILGLEAETQITPERKIEVVEALFEDPTLAEDVFELSFWLRH